MKTEIKINMFHVATQQLYQEITTHKRKQERHIYRSKKSKLEGMIDFLGLFFAEILEDERGYYIVSPFDLSKVITYAKRIRKFIDERKNGLGRTLYTRKEYNKIYINN